jgi:CelD/BcsL family acetyltransferase involved in cellulose biosynthesis
MGKVTAADEHHHRVSGHFPATDRGPRILVLPDLAAWATRWNRLVDVAPIASPFMRSWWLTGTGGPLRRFVLVVDGDRLLGGLALEERRLPGLQYLRMMGSGRLCPDHLDMLSAPGDEDTTIRLIGAWLDRPGARLIDLEAVPEGSRLTEVLPGPVRREPFAAAPFTPLPDSSDAYLASLPSQFRRQVRKATARLAAEGATHRTERGASAVRSLDTLRRLHEAQWGGRSRFLPNFDRFATGCRRGAEVDEVVVHELATEDTVISTVVCFEVAGRVSLYQSARLTDPHWREVTTVLLSAIITDACDRGFTEVDFLRGEEPYKRRFAPDRRTMVRLLAAKGGAGRGALLAETVRSTTRLGAERSVGLGRRLLDRKKP